MRNTKANRTKFLQGYLKILLSWKDKKQYTSKMKKALEELNCSLPNKRKIILLKSISDLRSNLGSNLRSNLGSDLRSNLWSNLGSDLRSNLGSDLRSNLGSDLRSNLWSDLRSNLWSDLRSNLGSDLWSNLWSDLRSNLWSDLRSNLGSDLRSNLGSDLWSNLWSDLRSNLWSDLRSNSWEYYEFIWPVFVGQFYKNLPTIKKRSKTIRALDKCIKSGIGYLWLSSTTIYAIPFPKISIDEEKRLHCVDGPACRWSKEEKSWWIYGVKVNQKIVETPDKLTKKDWLNEPNLETRRIIQERMPNFVKKIGGKSIDKSERGELLEVDLGSDPEKIAHYVKVKDSSTNRIYYLRTPPTTNTVDESISWTFGIESKDYHPLQET